MESITYDCPNCLTHYDVWNESKGNITPEKHQAFQDVVEKQKALGYCKKCHRDDGIRTTFEMDGLYTQRDLHDRFYIMKPCLVCGKYNKQDMRKHDKPCVFCGGDMGKSSTYWNSLRTYKEGRKLTAADRKKMGA